ncbi:hypothetical protein ACFOGJ_18365 [Marinibaculum pumilum]|uniref:Permease n=1 Tax=Marinibaculum pumilum TaxID=1766165 RepID=A0ABV7L4N9_9PROT
MLLSIATVWTIAALLAGFAAWRRPNAHRPALATGWSMLKPLMLRLPLAILAASFLSQLLPKAVVAHWLGDSSGFGGILLAAVIGGLFPGGPMVSFPIVVAVYQAGAGSAQTVALLTAWSIYAIHRVMAFELPMLGTRFVLFRLGVSLILPVLAGLCAGLIQSALGWQMDLAAGGVQLPGSP